MDIRTSDEDDQIQSSSTSTSGKSSTHSDIQSKQAQKSDNIDQEQSTKTDIGTHPSIRKEPLIQRKSYNHDILVIQTQPPKVKQSTRGNIRLIVLCL
jgi:hypothetical protein